jgi:hypothetical protein
MPVSPGSGPCHLRVFYGRPQKFLDDTLWEGPCGGLFVATDQPLLAGDPVLLEVHVQGAPNGVFLDGSVRWVRRAAGAARGKPPGVGIEFSDACLKRVTFLRRLARGEVTQALTRRKRRTPVALPAKAVAGNGGPVDVVLRDVSQGGAFVAGERVPTADKFQLEFDSPYTRQHIVVGAEVRWRSSAPRGAGVQFTFDAPAHRLALAAFVSRVECESEPVTVLG